MSSLFNNAQNIHIAGGSFNATTNSNTVNEPSLDVLHKHVAPNAILNAGGRADEVRCYPGTREAIIEHIEKWGDMHDGLTAPIFWLSGPAGAGKSAIMQTLAERCDQRGVPHANFFFFRADRTRSHASPLMTTLLHQLISLHEPLGKEVASVLSKKPLIMNSTFENQLAQLVEPIHTIRASELSAYRPIMLLIDGLDECDSDTKHSQQQILQAFDRVLAKERCPFRLLVASRDESQIRAAFNRLSSPCLHLFLDGQYSPENDIRLFVNAQFQQIRKTHPLCHTLDDTWPSPKDIDYIVEKSSGQFIYAATVMRFISDSSASLALSLERVQGAARLATKSPFSHLDAIYSYILSQADDQQAIKDLLHAQILRRRIGTTPLPSLMELLELYNPDYNKALVFSCLADLTPLAWYESNDRELLFHHASFPDYLLDPSRSMNYFVDTTAFCQNLLPIVVNFINNGPCDKHWPLLGVGSMKQLQKLPPNFMNTLSSSKYACSSLQLHDRFFFNVLRDLCVDDDDVVKFRRILYRWINNGPPDREKFYLLQHIPFIYRYYYMSCANHYCREAPDNLMLAALSPKSDFDRDESASWLKGLLHHIHKEIFSRDRVIYKQLVKEWISWAVQNDISCGSLGDLPDAQWYIRASTTKKWAARNFRFGSRRK